MQKLLIKLILILVLYPLHFSTCYGQYLFSSQFLSSLDDSISFNKWGFSGKEHQRTIPPAARVNRINETPPWGVHYDRLILSGITLISLNIAAYQPFKHTWWKEERGAFHLYRGWRRDTGWWDFGWNDSIYGHMDKLGHYFSSRLLSEQLSYLSSWIGFDKRASQWIGPILSSLLMLEIEIYDGFFNNWGFSLADFTANELGAFTPLLADSAPFLKNFHFKLSYHISGQPANEPTFIKDYAGMTFWLSWNVHSVLPKQIKNHYPSWLNMALGYSISKQARGEVELYIAPDINWEKIAWGKSDTAQFVKKVLNYFHFPCFAWQFKPESKFHPIYY